MVNVATSGTGALAPVGVLSQFAAAGSWDTTIYIINNTAAAVPVRLVFYADAGTQGIKTSDGNPAILTVTQQGDTQTGAATTLDRVVSPNTTLIVGAGLGSAFPVAQGWVQVLATTPISGFAVFRYVFTGLTSGISGFVAPYEGTVPLQTNLSVSTITLPFDNSSPSFAATGAQFTTGIAIGSLTGGSVTATFYDVNGTQLGTQKFALGANGHTAFMVNTAASYSPNGQDWSFTNGKQGTVVFSGPSLIGLGLRASPYGTLTTVPAVLQ